MSFEIIIDDTKITRKQEGNPVVEIQKEQITEIKEAIGYGITIIYKLNTEKLYHNEVSKYMVCLSAVILRKGTRELIREYGVQHENDLW